MSEIASSFRGAAAIKRASAALGEALAANGIDPGVVDAFMLSVADAEELQVSPMRKLLREGVPEILPTVGPIIGGLNMFYAGRTNMLYGRDGVGKSFIALQAVIEELARGEQVLWIDFEEQNDLTLISRLQAMRIPEEYGDRLHVVHPERRLSLANMRQLLALAANCTLVVLDSVGEMLAIHGADSNSDKDVSTWLFEHFARPLAAVGPAVLLIDHTTKAGDGRTAGGSQRKRAALSGAAYGVHVQNDEDSWSKDTGGFSIITTWKDRLGNHQPNTIAAFVELIPASDATPLVVSITKHQPADLVIRDDDNEPIEADSREHPKNSIQHKHSLIEAFVRRPGLESFTNDDVLNFLRKDNNVQVAIGVVQIKLDELAKQGVIMKVSPYAYAMPNLFIVDSED